MDNRQQYPNYDYSTLEVAQQQHGEHSHTQQSSPAPDYGQHGYATGGYPDPAYQTDPRKYSPQPYEGQNLPQVVDPVYPEVAPKPEAVPVVTEPKGDYAGYQDHQHAQHPVPAPAERRIWGLKRKTFFIVLALVLLVIIGAAVGGGVGGTVGKNGEKKGDPSTGGSGAGGGSGGGGSPGNTTHNSPVLGNSKLAAVNWTDSSNVEFNAVFWQAKTNDLMMSLWDSNGKSWDQVNITDKMGQTTLNFTAKSGTSLAAVVRGHPWTTSKIKNVSGDFGIALFYISPDDTVLEVYSADPRGAAWKLGDLSTSANKMRTAPNSQVGAWWSLCELNCTGNILLAYEDETQSLRIANSSDWTAFSILRNIADGASLAFTVMSGDHGQNGPQKNDARLYYESSGKLSELMWTLGGPWYYGSDIAKNLPGTPPQIAASGFSDPSALDEGPINIMLAGAYPNNGTPFVAYWDNTTWHNATTPILQGKVLLNYTAVAAFESEQLKFFGLTNESEIHGYIVDKKNPQSWTYDQEVVTK